jgi:hypothetical protein
MLRRRIVVIVATLMVLAALGVYYAGFVRQMDVLVIEDLRGELGFAYVILPEAEEYTPTFQIQYTHSVHLSEVLESYIITPARQIKQVTLEYEDFAIGMPANAEGDETFTVTDDGRYLISNMNRTFTEINLRIGQVKADHRLIYLGRTYRLATVMEPGTLVQIRVDRRNAVSLMRGAQLID